MTGNERGKGGGGKTRERERTAVLVEGREKHLLFVSLIPYGYTQQTATCGKSCDNTLQHLGCSPKVQGDPASCI